MDNGVYEEFTSVSSHVCNELFSIGDDGFETRRIASVCKLFGRYQEFERKFSKLIDHSCTSDGKFKGGESSTQCQKTIVFHHSHG